PRRKLPGNRRYQRKTDPPAFSQQFNQGRTRSGDLRNNGILWAVKPSDQAKKVIILQSNYIPWKGYFDLMRSADEFVILDDVQFTKRDWRNRNLIKTQHGLHWLTIPVKSKGLQRINEVEISEPDWHVSHWKTISRSLCRATYFDHY